MKKIITAFIIILLAVAAYLAVRYFSTPTLQGVTPKQAIALYNPNGNSIQGNSHGKVTMVEFFGYNCHFCRLAYPVIQQFIKTHPDVRVVYKEYLLFGDKSKLPSYTALAAQKQGKYLAMHDAMLTANKPLTRDEIIKLAKTQHLNISKLLIDINNPSIHQQITANTALSKALVINGAPTVIFVNSKAVKHPNQISHYEQYIQIGHINAKVLDRLFAKAEANK